MDMMDFTLMYSVILGSWRPCQLQVKTPNLHAWTSVVTTGHAARSSYTADG